MSEKLRRCTCSTEGHGTDCEVGLEMKRKAKTSSKRDRRARDKKEVKRQLDDEEA